jgi:hypothetical protein
MEDEETNFSLPSLIDSESLLQEVIFLFKFFPIIDKFIFIKIVIFINNRNLIIFRLDLWNTWTTMRKRRPLPPSRQLGVKARARARVKQLQHLQRRLHVPRLPHFIWRMKNLQLIKFNKNLKLKFNICIRIL